MPIPSNITDLNTDPALNSPPGDEPMPLTRGYLNAHAAFIRRLFNGISSLVLPGNAKRFQKVNSAGTGLVASLTTEEDNGRLKINGTAEAALVLADGSGNNWRQYASTSGQFSIGSVDANYTAGSEAYTINKSGPLAISAHNFLVNGAAKFTINENSSSFTFNTSDPNGLKIANSGAAGANLTLLGQGAVTPKKTIRVNNGNLEIINDAYTSVISSITDQGDLTVAKGLRMPNFTSFIVRRTTSLTLTNNLQNLSFDQFIYNTGSFDGVTFVSPFNAIYQINLDISVNFDAAAQPDAVIQIVIQGLNSASIFERKNMPVGQNGVATCNFSRRVLLNQGSAFYVTANLANAADGQAFVLAEAVFSVAAQTLTA